RQARQALAPAPLQYRRLDVHANGTPLRAASGPFAGGTGGAGEIFAETTRQALARISESALEEVYLGGRIVHGTLVEHHAIGTLSHRRGTALAAACRAA